MSKLGKRVKKLERRFKFDDWYAVGIMPGLVMYCDKCGKITTQDYTDNGFLCNGCGTNWHNAPIETPVSASGGVQVSMQDIKDDAHGDVFGFHPLSNSVQGTLPDDAKPFIPKEDADDAKYGVNFQGEQTANPTTEVPFIDFQECESCASKPGAATLCPACQHNRRIAERLRKLMRDFPPAGNEFPHPQPELVKTAVEHVLPEEFKRDLMHIINKHSLEGGSDTPDYILAEFLCSCLLAFNSTVKARSKWFGKD